MSRRLQRRFRNLRLIPSRLTIITGIRRATVLLSNNVQNNPHEYEGADWDQYCAEFNRYMGRFLPAALKLVLPMV